MPVESGGQSSTRRRIVFALIFLTGAAMSSAVGLGPGWAGVGQSFIDVPPTHPFYEEVEGVAGACVAGGYADGTYRPSGVVTRQAMAAFLDRIASKAVNGQKVGGSNPTFGSGNGTSPRVPVATVTVTVPDLPGSCVVPVQVHGTTTLALVGTPATSCFDGLSCLALASLAVDDVVESDTTVQGRFADRATRFPVAPSMIYLQPDGTEVTYSLVVSGSGVMAGMGEVNASRQIYAVTHPMQAQAGP